MNQIELGYRIKQCRQMQHLTQEKLAEIIDVSPHYIYEVEKGLKCMSLNTFTEIASALNTSTDYLISGTQAPSRASSNTEISFDRLSLLLSNLTPQQRDNLADILTTLLPKLK